MNKEDRFEHIWVDLTEFGWGVRKVPVVWPEEHEGSGLTPGVQIPDNTVGSPAIIDGSIQSQDLSDEVKDKLRVSYDDEGGGIKIGGL